MRVTFTLSNLTDDFYAQFLPGDPAERFAYLTRQATGDLRHNIKCKIATGQFRDAVELNSIRKGPMTVTCEGPLPRRGYKLFVFDVSRARPYLRGEG